MQKNCRPKNFSLIKKEAKNMKNDFYMFTATKLKNYIKENGAIVAEISKSFII